MERDTIRLECLKLAVTKTSDQKEIIVRAEQFVEFVGNTIPGADVTVGKDDSLPGQTGMKMAPPNGG